MSIPVIACTLSPDEHRCCADELLPGLAKLAGRVRRLDDGVRLEFDAAPGIVARVASVVERERSCCQFLRFALDVAPALGGVTLTVDGPPGTGAFLESLSPAFARESSTPI